MVCLLVGGCGSASAVRDTGALAACVEAYRVMDQAAWRAGVRDGEAYPVPGFPWLRSDRFLASFAEAELDDAAFAAWIERMARLDREGRAVELANLSGGERRALDGRLQAEVGAGWSVPRVLEDCPGSMTQALQADLDARASLPGAVQVPDDYGTLVRTVGLYPLSAIPVALGFERWKGAVLPAFEVPFGAESWRGRPVLFEPPAGPGIDRQEVAAVLTAAAGNPLGVPEVEGAALERLALAFAPALLVDVATEDDRIGHPFWRDDGSPAVDPTRPTAVVRTAHSWFEGRPVLQLVYLFWFDARPKEGTLDFLSGRLDGLIWRVTLGRDGTAVLFDTIHPCGCYHLFFPNDETRRVPVAEDAPDDLREAPLVPMTLDIEAPEERTLVRIAASSHYVTRVGGRQDLKAGARRVPYTLSIGNIPDLPLRVMQKTGGTRSLYRADGIIDGTGRLERAILWPMGIEEPGAMRQWGRHATAFVGRRHFDDPHLLEQAFVR